MNTEKNNTLLLAYCAHNDKDNNSAGIFLFRLLQFRLPPFRLLQFCLLVFRLLNFSSQKLLF